MYSSLAKDQPAYGGNKLTQHAAGGLKYTTDSIKSIKYADGGGTLNQLRKKVVVVMT